ncbi:hypothetical protein [Acetobacterium wieringae]|uniref:hypothetical protein n=1 Tax=Acetobacterium wieringae TaxID=52694 RepID=UPI0020349BBB|nr:hypothetical protein [Acetobacterium wieringae]URN84257.1 hypothetical protein CHL1_003443 [Acetobacterium wieringae]
MNKRYSITSSYDVIYEALLPKLAECNLAESAARFGLNIDAKGQITINFLKRDYRISNTGVTPVEIQTQFDVTAPEILEFECLAFLCGCLVRALIKTAEYGTVDGWV